MTPVWILLNSFRRFAGASVVSVAKIVLASVTDTNFRDMRLTMTEHYGLPNARAMREQEEDMGSWGNMDFRAKTQIKIKPEWTAKAYKYKQNV